jgi:hypothetical protein
MDSAYGAAAVASRELAASATSSIAVSHWWLVDMGMDWIFTWGGNGLATVVSSQSNLIFIYFYFKII